mgnify:FL=1
MHVTAVKKGLLFFFALLALLLWARSVGGQQPRDIIEHRGGRLAFVIDAEGPIGPATRDFITRSIEEAARRDAALLVIRMDTPGGLDASTRDMIKAILTSQVPVATWVAPEGARASSYGTYILYPSQEAAMSPATNVDAATQESMMCAPNSPTGQSPPGTPHSDEEDKFP